MAGGTNCRVLKPSSALTRNRGTDTNNFEFLMLKAHRTYSACEFRSKYECDNEM